MPPVASAAVARARAARSASALVYPRRCRPCSSERYVTMSTPTVDSTPSSPRRDPRRTRASPRKNHLIAHLSARADLRDLSAPSKRDYVALHLDQGTWPFAVATRAGSARELLASGYGVAACRGRGGRASARWRSRECAALPDPRRAQCMKSMPLL